MKKYEYQFIDVSPQNGFRTKPGDTFAECKKVILEQAEKGWRLKQVVTPFHEKLGVSSFLGYTVIFEKEAE